MAGKVKADELFDVKELNKRLDELVKKIVANDDALKALVTTMTKSNESLVAMSKNVKDFNDVKKRTVDVEKEAIKLQNQAVETNKRTLIAQEKYNQELEKTKRQVIQTEKAVNSLEKSKNRGAKATNNWTTALNSFQTKFNTIGNLVGGLALGAFGSLLGVLQKIISTNVEFDKSLKSLQSITGATSEEINFYSKAAKEMSKTSTQSATDIIKAYEAVGSAVPILLKNKEALAEVTKQAIILSEASAGKMGVRESAEVLTAAMNQFNLTANDASRIINTLAAGELEGSATSTELAGSMKNVGTVAKGANMTLEQTVAVLEILASKQLKGEEAGTKLRGSILKLQDAGYGYQSGSFVLKDALTEVNGKMSEQKTEAEKDALALQIFGLENKTAGSILLENVGIYEELTKKVTGTNTALEQQRIQNESTAAQWKKLGNEMINTFTSDNLSTSMAVFLKAMRYIWQAVSTGWSLSFGNIVAGITDVYNISKAVITKLKGGEFEFTSALKANAVNLIESWKNFDKQAEQTTAKIKELTAEEIAATKAKEDADKKAYAAEIARQEAEKKAAKDRIQYIKDERKATEDFANTKDLVGKESEVKGNDVIIGQLGVIKATNKEINNEKSEQQIKDEEDAARRADAILNEIALRKEAASITGEIALAGSDLAASLNDKKIQGIEIARDTELSALENTYNKDIEKAGDNEEKKKKLKIKYDDEKKKAEDKYQKEIGKIKKKQFIIDKVASIISAGIQGALAIISSLKTPFLTPFITTAVGLQIAAIAASPIPEFATGVRDFEGGIADVGEKGREIIRTKEGQMFLTPNTRTRVNLPSGSDVFKNEETERMLKGGMSVDGLNKLISSNEKIEKSIKNIKIMNTNISGGTVERIIQVGRVNTRLLNKYFA